MADITKTSFSSNFYYPEIIYNELITIASGSTITINHNYGKPPIVRVWGELFSGEFSSVWASSAQYDFMAEYSNQNIYGFTIEINNMSVIIESFSPTRRMYVRMYANE